MTKYYLDTCVLLDYYEKRGKNGEIALKLINKINERQDFVIYSDLHIIELKKLDYKYKEINGIFKVFNSIIKAHVNNEQLNEAKILVNHIKIPRKDALHAVIARDNEAILISHDKHFELLKYLIEVKTPLELVEFSF